MTRLSLRCCCLFVALSPGLAQAQTAPGSAAAMQQGAKALNPAPQQPAQRIQAVAPGGGPPVRTAVRPASDIQPIVQPPAVAPIPQPPEWVAQLSVKELKWIDEVLHYWEARSDKVKLFECKFQRWDHEGGFIDAEGKHQPRTFAEGSIKYEQPDKGLYHVENLVAVMPPAKPGDKPQFVGHALLPGALARSRTLFVREYAGDLDAPATDAQIIAPGLVVTDTLELDLGGRKLGLKAWPKAHTDCDLTVFDESSGTLFTGDLLFRDRVPALDGSALGWLAAMDSLARLNAHHVVPGHGPVARDVRAAMAPQRRYVHVLVEGTRAAIAHGKSMSDAIARVGSGEMPHWQLWDSAHAHNVARVYQELEWE